MDKRNQPTCHKCHSPSNKLFLCTCVGCNHLFHFSCIPDRKNTFDDVVCNDCKAFQTNPRLLGCLKKENQLLRTELKKSDELIQLYKTQAEECTAMVEGLLRLYDEDGEKENEKGGENDNGNGQ